MSRRMHLGFDISYCHMDGRWRMPHAWAGRAYPDMAMFEETARIAERGCLDMIFSGDGTGIPSTGVAHAMLPCNGESPGLGWR